MNKIADKWKNKYGIKFFKDIGVKKGDKVRQISRYNFTI